MFRLALRASSALRQTTSQCMRNGIGGVSIRHNHGKVETDDEFDKRYVDFFSRPDIDHWEVRKAINDLSGEDIIPEPKIIVEALKACRRLNDYSLAVRYLESVQWKCGNKKDKIWPWIHQEIKPTLEELGILTPEEMGYDTPELAMKSVYDM